MIMDLLKTVVLSKITDAVDSQYREGIFAKPNRFIWMDPTVKHDI